MSVDSGATESVVPDEIPSSVPTTPGSASRRGVQYEVANGERIPNRGQVSLEMKSGNIPIKSTFQVSKISKPLWSVGKLCDAGFKVEFGKSAAIVTHEKSGKKIGEFARHQGLYIGSLQLKNPSFTRQA